MDDGGDAGYNRHPFYTHRQGSKRNFSTMSAEHREGSPDSLFLPPADPHYDNEHVSRRRRITEDSSARFAGDGLDYRRQVMSTSQRGGGEGQEHEGGVGRVGNGQGSGSGAARAMPVIDLTDEDDVQELGSADADSQSTFTAHSNTATAGSSSRINHRLPRFGRDVIDVANLEEEDDAVFDEADYQHLPGMEFLDFPPRQNGRVQYSTLRRPTRVPTPIPDMDDSEVQITGSREFASVHARRPTPAPRSDYRPALTHHHLHEMPTRPPPSGDHIDLTEDAEGDDDDDVVIVDERRRAGDNLTAPTGNAGGPRFGVAHLADLLHQYGGNPAGRLMQRARGNAYGTPEHEQHGGDFRRMTDEQLRDRGEHLRQRINERQAERDPERAERMRDFERTIRGESDDQLADRVVHSRRRRDDPARAAAIARADRVLAARRAVHNPVGRRPIIPQINPLGNLGMDYGMAAFDMGTGGAPPRPPTPKYSPPPEPEEGFTRHPGENDSVVCPNCGDELAVGVEELKQEVWVVKSCGHAYCGECHKHCNRSKKGKGKAVEGEEFLPAPFKNCVVPGCNKPAGSKSWIRVFFGS